LTQVYPEEITWSHRHSEKGGLLPESSLRVARCGVYPIGLYNISPIQGPPDGTGQLLCRQRLLNQIDARIRCTIAFREYRSHAHGCCGSGVYHDCGGRIVSSIAVQLSVVSSNAQDRRDATSCYFTSYRSV
jgi:hypothetical protein